jgi:hypothetical protein
MPTYRITVEGRSWHVWAPDIVTAIQPAKHHKALKVELIPPAGRRSTDYGGASLLSDTRPRLRRLTDGPIW